MATYFAATVTVAYTAWLFVITSLTCGDSTGGAPEKCDVRVWYISKIGDGMFPLELTEEQQTIKTTIENMIQKSSANPEISHVDCSVLDMYESMFRPARANDGPESAEEDGETEEEEKEEENSGLEDLEVDETEMSDDDTDSEDTGDVDEANGGDMAKRGSSGTVNKTIDVMKSALAPLARKCRRQRSNTTAVSCAFINTVTFRCFLQMTEESLTKNDTLMEQDDTANGSEENKDKNEGRVASWGDERRVTHDPKAMALTQEKYPEMERLGEENPTMEEPEKDNDKVSQHDDVEASKHDKEATRGLRTENSASQDSNGSHIREASSASETDDKQSAVNIDITVFQQMIEKRASEYMLKIQTMETQIMRVENELLMEKLNKQNHTSSFSRLENQILRLENELLKMTLSYEELKEENEKILKKQKSFLELDYVKRPGDFRRLPDNSTKQFELISQHQNKISELTDHLRNQSQLIDKIKGQSDSLEDQNRILFQIVMNQTMLISEMMKKVESLSDSNLKHHVQQQLITDKLGITLGTSDVMEALHSFVSDKFPLATNDAGKTEASESSTNKSPVNYKGARLSLSFCNHPDRSRASCGFNSIVLSQCLRSDNVSVFPNSLSSVPDFERQDESVMKETIKDSQNVPQDISESSDPASEKSGEETCNSASHADKRDDSVEDLKDESEESAERQATDEKGRDTKHYDEKPNKDADEEITDNTAENGVKESVSMEKATDNTASTQNAEDKTTSTQNAKREETNTNKARDEETTTKKDTDEAIGTKEAANDEITTKKAADDETTTKKSTGEKTTTKNATDEATSQKPTPAKERPEHKTKKKTAPKQSDKKDNGGKKRASKKENAGAKVSKKKKANKADAKKPKVERIPPLYSGSRRAEPKDCADYFRRGKQKDGLYKVKLYGSREMLSVFCDMKNGGWTVIQRRQDGTVNFFRTWDEYKKGFGGVYGEHWLGNDVIHRLTNQDQYELRVDLMDWNRTKKFAQYEYVRVDDEAAGYMLHVEGYSGDAGDGFSKHSGEKFSTKDKDNDRVVKEFDGSCANRFKGAWWYYKCYSSNLNGKFYKNGHIPEKQFDGITWKPWTGPNISLKKVELKVRPIK